MTGAIRKADAKRRRKENTAGRFFIDEECISCGACWKLAPDLIHSHIVHTFAYFARQPQNPQEEELSHEAIRICPVGAIGEENS